MIRRFIILPPPTAASKEERSGTRLSSMEELEKGHIVDVLRQCNGKIAGKGGAAEFLKMNTSTLNSRIKKLGIQKLKNIY